MRFTDTGGLLRCESFHLYPLLWCLIFVSLVGCGSSARLVLRSEEGTGRPSTFVVRSNEEPVELRKDEFQKAWTPALREVKPVTNNLQYSRWLMFGPSWSQVVNLTWDGRSLRLDSASHEVLRFFQQRRALTDDYERWCERERHSHDCLGLLRENTLLGADGRYALAMEFALDSVWTESLNAFKDIADPSAVRSLIVSAMAMYMMLWVMPEPVSKGVAATLTAGLIVYLGVDTVWTLMNGWMQLVDEADRASTFAELRRTGERFGKIMGQNTARVFILLATVALGRTVNLTTQELLPSRLTPSVIRAGTEEVSSVLAQSEVTSVSVSSEGLFSLALGPRLMAMTHQATDGGSNSAPEHHIATNKWNDATHSGGPWTPRFQEIFDRAEMSLEDPANKIRLPEHQGPHPQAYHEEVFERLDRATSVCRTPQQCRQALVGALERLAQEISTPGSRLNILLTRGK